MADDGRARLRCVNCGEALAEFVSHWLCPGCLLKEGMGARFGVESADEAPTMVAIDQDSDAGLPSLLWAGAPSGSGERVLQPGEMIGGRYRIIRRLGGGGMGVVYRAEQMRVDREVALKTISPGVASEELMHRMAGEISTLGRMNHPNIVRVFDADVDDDGDGLRPLLYFTMEIVDGETLDAWLAVDGGRTVDEKLACFAGICDAVAFAHGRDVVHRDLKPGNIMVRVDGTPAVLDFGIARVREQRGDKEVPKGGRDLSEEGSGGLPTPLMATGTPDYMSPAKWRSEDDFEAGDLFALGVIFFEMFAGHRPWRFSPGTPLTEKQKTISNFKVPSLASVTKEADARIDAMASHLLAPEASDRPTAPEALDLVRDLIRRRARRAALQHWAPAIAGGLLLIIALSGWGISWLWKRERLLDSEEVHRALVLQLETSGIDPQAETIRVLPPTSAARHDSSAWRDVVVRAASQWRLLPRLVSKLEVPAGWQVVAADRALSSLLLTDGGGKVAWFDEGRMTRLPWSCGSGEIEALFSPDSSLVAIWSTGGHVFIGDLASLDLIDLGQHAIAGSAIAFSSDGSRFAIGTVAFGTEELERQPLARIRLWDVGSWEERPVLERRSDPEAPLEDQIAFRDVKRIAFSADGRFLAAAGERQHVFVWDMESMKVHATLHHLKSVTALAWNSASSEPLLATGQRDGQVLVWKIDAGDREGAFRHDPNLAFGTSRGAASAPASRLRRRELELLRWLPGEAELIAVDSGGGVEAWGLWRQASPTRVFDLDVGGSALRWHTSAHALSAIPRDRSEPIRVWDWDAGSTAKRFFLARPVDWLDLNSDGSFLVACSTHGGAVYDLSAQKVALPINENLTGAPRFESVGGGGLWVAGYHRGVVRIDPESLSREGTFDSAGQVIWQASRSNTNLAFARREGSMVVARGQEVVRFEPAQMDGLIPEIGDGFSLPGSTADGLDLALHQDGEWLIASWDNELRGGLFRLDGLQGWKADTAFAPSRGETFAFGADPGVLVVYDAPWIRRWRLSESRFEDAFKLPDLEEATVQRSYLAVASDVGSLVVATAGSPLALQMAEGGVEEWARLDGSTSGEVRALAVSPDGRFAAVAEPCWGGTLLTVWDLDFLQRFLEQLKFEPFSLSQENSN